MLPGYQTPKSVPIPVDRLSLKIKNTTQSIYSLEKLELESQLLRVMSTSLSVLVES